jgi:hypothetical protein
MLEGFLWLIVLAITFYTSLFIWRLFVLLCSLVYELYKFVASMFQRKRSL